MTDVHRRGRDGTHSADGFERLRRDGTSVATRLDASSMPPPRDGFREIVYRQYRRIYLVGVGVLLECTALCAQNPGFAREEENVAPVSAALCSDMKRRHVLNAGAPVPCERLRLVTFSYVGMDGQLNNNGQIVVIDAIAGHVLQVFKELRRRRFPIASAKLMSEFDGDDVTSMDRDNTSAFNVREIAGGGPVSLHAYGAAIDVNPIQNPYVKRSGRVHVVSPRSGADYMDRKNLRPGMAETIVDVFAEHGLSIWGGDWNDPIDYQHFQISRKLADQLAKRPVDNAQALFERHVEEVRSCLKASVDRGRSGRRACAGRD